MAHRTQESVQPAPTTYPLGAAPGKCKPDRCGPRHKVVGQCLDGDFEVQVHTIGSNRVWELPIWAIVWGPASERILQGMDPKDAFRLGYFASQWRNAQHGQQEGVHHG
jgi:hypothetical protein